MTSSHFLMASHSSYMYLPTSLICILVSFFSCDWLAVLKLQVVGDPSSYEINLGQVLMKS